jgi:alpha-D-xyloside xylohydrolase
MLRRTQAVCFSPLALFNGWATDDKLWSHPEVAEHIRAAIVWRMRLLPYLYTTFAEYRHAGTPVIRPMPLVPGFRPPSSSATSGALDATANPYAIGKVTEVKDQYMLGDALLVAPLAAGATSRTVVLPTGRWYDFFSGRFVGEGTTITVSPELAQIPVFVRDGSLIPLLAERQWSPAADEILPLEIRHYGESAGQLRLYDDDGETFAYENGEHSWTQLEVRRAPSGAWSTTVTPDPNGRAWRYRDVRWTFMTAP